MVIIIYICIYIYTYIYIYIYIFFFFWPRHVACGILVPPPRIEPVPPAVEAQSFFSLNLLLLLLFFFFFGCVGSSLLCAGFL